MKTILLILSILLSSCYNQTFFNHSFNLHREYTGLLIFQDNRSVIFMEYENNEYDEIDFKNIGFACYLTKIYGKEKLYYELKRRAKPFKFYLDITTVILSDQSYHGGIKHESEYLPVKIKFKDMSPKNLEFYVVQHFDSDLDMSQDIFKFPMFLNSITLDWVEVDSEKWYLKDY